MPAPIPRVGAPDHTLRTSPILDDEAEISLDDEVETAVCYFNGSTYPLQSYVLSGTELLCCEGRGVWVRKGEIRPEETET